MASFRDTRFSDATFGQSYPGNNFNMNPSNDNQFRPQYQRPPNPPFRPFHTPKRFVQGNFQNRPPFSNFPDANAMRNRPPPPTQVFRPQIPPPNQMFRMNMPPPSDQLFRISTPPPDQIFRMNQHPPDQMFHINLPPSPDVFRTNPPPSDAFRINPPPSDAFRANPPLSDVLRINPPPSDAFRINPPPSDAFRMNVPPPDRSFRSPTPGTKLFDTSAQFERPFRPRNPTHSFRNNPRPPFQNRHFSQASSYQQKDLPLQANKKRKQKMREVRKIKEDTTEKPFSCDTCDRAFTNEDELREHLSLHTKCDRGNCTFEAHPKIVALHQRMQHDTGYADSINKLKDDAEIQKWREERRRRFPTAENVKKRQAEQAEREARGEVLETKEFGKFKQRREENGNLTRNRRQMRRRGSFRRQDRTRNFRHYQISQTSTVNLDSDSDSDCDSHIKLKKFSGIQSLTNSASKKCVASEDAEVISNPHASNIVNEFIPSENISEQNLSKSDFDNDTSTARQDEMSYVLNHEQVDEVALLADESVCEIPEDEIKCVKEVHSIIDLNDSNDEGPEVIPISKSLETSNNGVSQNIEDSDNEGPISIPIQKSANGGTGNEDADNIDSEISQNVKPVQNPDFRDHQTNERNKEKFCEASDKRKRDENDEHHKRPKKENFKRNNFNAQNPACQVRKSSLLEKLLADDIRHERNVVLQCIRHIVNNDFFGMDNGKS